MSLSLTEALRDLRARRGAGDVIVTTMSAAREWMALGPLHPLDMVLVPSSMGQASSLALGLALARPDRRVVVVNGDGSLLMNLGSLATIAALRPENLAMVVVANRVYEVTGAQPTPGPAGGVDFGAVARGCGWDAVDSCASLEAWRGTTVPSLLTAPGPRLVVLEVGPMAGAAGPRSPGPARDRAAAFARALGDAR